MAPPNKITKSGSVDPKVAEIRPSPAVIFSASRSPPSSKAAANPVPKKSPPSDDSHKIEAVPAIAADLAELKITPETLSQVDQAIPDKSPPSMPKGGEDVLSHLSESSHKPASSDTKSLASEHTFNLEEKESLRPDDSASVQALDDEEPFFVPPMAARTDLQSTAEAFDPDLDQTNLPRGPTINSAPGFALTPMTSSLRFGDIVPTMPPNFAPAMAAPGSFARDHANMDAIPPNQAGSILPDQKLVEAMGTARDRFFLLQLEEKFLTFLQTSK